MAKHLEGKVVIVTGSGQGIGRGIAVGLAREGAKVLTNNRKPKGYSASQFRREDMPEEDWKELCRLKGDAEMTAEIISSEGGEAMPFYGDCSDWGTAEKMVRAAVEKWGRIDIIVNNAAGTGTGSVEAMTEENWDHFNTGRTKAAIALMHFAFPGVRQDRQYRQRRLGRPGRKFRLFLLDCRHGGPDIRRGQGTGSVWYHGELSLPPGRFPGSRGGIQ